MLYILLYIILDTKGSDLRDYESRKYNQSLLV
nr:MAG TPA: hypothetical protein [Caudoviricetes sp.]